MLSARTVTWDYPQHLNDAISGLTLSFSLLLSPTSAYHNLESIVKPLKERELKGALIDTYVAGEMLELNSPELRVNKIIDHNTYYGVVFGQGRLAKQKFQVCFEDYVLSNQADIFKTVKEKTTPMEVCLMTKAVNKR